MKVEFGNSSSNGGPGVSVSLTGDEVAAAIDLFLSANAILVSGPRTTYVNGDLIQGGEVFVDPSGSVLKEGTRMNGNGSIDL